MVNLFWNASQGRLRAFWRLLIQNAAFYAGVLAMGVGLGVAIAVWALVGRGALPSAARLSALVDHPAVRALAALTSLVAALATVGLAGRFLDRRHLAGFGFHLGRGWWLDLGFGLLLGAVLMGGIFLVERAAGWLAIGGTLQPGGLGLPFLGGLLLALIAYIGVGIYEEALFRGYQLLNLAEGLNFRPLRGRGAVSVAWVLSSLAFGLAHILNPHTTALSTFNLFLAGLFLGLPYVLTGELAIPIGLHIGWNFAQGNLFGFPVSGTNAGLSLVTIAQGGPALWTGAAFGPEGGLIGVVAMLVGSALVAGWVRWRYGRVGLRQELAEYGGQALEETGADLQKQG